MPTNSPTEPKLNRNVILALACVAQFMVVLDLAIVNVALPAMRDDLDLSGSGLQWVVNAYTLAFAGFLLLGGRAADLFGSRKIFMLGLALFGGASVVGGLASDGALLIAARAAQGFGGAILSPATLTIITTTFTDPRERGKAMGLWSAVAGGGGTAGAILGGVLTDLVNWRWIFLINVPIAIGALFVARKYLNIRNQRHATKLDAAGGVLVTLGLVSLVYAIVSTEEFGWSAPRTIATFALAAVLLTWFALHETKVAKEPLMPMSIWKIRSLTSANLVMLLSSSGMFAMWFLLSLELQNVRDYSPLRAGFSFIPLTVAIMAGAQLAPRLLPRIGARRMVISAYAISAVGLFWLAQATETSPYFTSFFIPGALTTFGMGLAIMPIISSAMVDVAPNQAGLASGLINTSRQVGGAIGLAVLSTLAANRTADELATATAPNLALLDGYGLGFLAASVTLVAALAAATLLPSPRSPKKVAARNDLETQAAAGLAEA
jgi:EmrB/QacA subfamily drug resistance transporter